MRIHPGVWLVLLVSAVGGLSGAVALAEDTAMTMGPTAAVLINRPSLRPNETLTISVTVTNPGSARSVDVYLSVQFPDGRTMLYLSPAGLAPGVRPLARAYALASGASLGPIPVLAVVLSASTAPGTYTWTFTLTDPDNLSAIIASASTAISVSAPSELILEMPVLASETANNFLGIWPFGVHGADHTYDGGHPGIDVEFIAGASVRAAADGTVQSVMTDFHDPTKTTVQIQHRFGQQGYRTVYTNIEHPVVVVGAQVAAGQPIGQAGRVTFTSGGSQIAYYMTHFQLDDFSYTNPVEGASNRNAVSPEPYLSPRGKARLDDLWASVAYDQELTEPFITNPRSALQPFPIRRTWTLRSTPQGSAFPARIDFIYKDPATNPAPESCHDYSVYDGTGNMIETGSVQLEPRARPLTTIDLQPRDRNGQPAGMPRLGVYDILSGSMRIDWGAPGAPRPTSLSNAAVYTTQ